MSPNVKENSLALLQSISHIALTCSASINPNAGSLKTASSE
jgi:hypothetical protein